MLSDCHHDQFGLVFRNRVARFNKLSRNSRQDAFVVVLYLICFSSFTFVLSDFTGPDAVRLQASVPGVDVDEHCSSYDDIIKQFNQSTTVVMLS